MPRNFDKRSFEYVHRAVVCSLGHSKQFVFEEARDRNVLFLIFDTKVRNNCDRSWIRKLSRRRD